MASLLPPPGVMSTGGKHRQILKWINFRSRRIRYIMLILLFVFTWYQWPGDDENHIKEMTDEELMVKYKVGNIKELSLSKRNIASGIDSPFSIGCREIETSAPRASAAFVMLARNSELNLVIKSMISLENHFNQWFNYPWVFLNDQEFDPIFKDTVAKYTSSTVEFGIIPKSDWEFPDTVDKDEMSEFIDSQGDRTILYGNNPSYHKMCRFFSNAFYKHPLVQKRDWYWRVEPDIEFFCDLTYDPFLEMEKHGKKYGFTIALHELYYTVPGLFRETKYFAKQHGIKANKLWRMLVKNFKYSQGRDERKYDGIKEPWDILREIELELTFEKYLGIKGKTDLTGLDKDLIRKLIRRSSDGPNLYEDRIDFEEFNLCHFWSNFEIAKTEIFTSDLYIKYFQHLENSGGFYKERWGDAAVHSLALALILDITDIHYFRDIGYKHSTIGHCPSNAKINQLAFVPVAKTNAHFKAYTPDKPQINGVGCRCKCPMWHKEIEDSGSSCIKQWHRVTRDDYTPAIPLDLDFYRKKINRRLDKYLRKGGKLGESHIAEDLMS